MIDSLNLIIPKQIDLSLLPNYTVKCFGNSGMVLYYVGRIGPLAVIVNPNTNSTAVKGSIRKYYLGDTELADLTFDQLAKALNKLRLSLHLSHAEFSESIITRVDVGTTIPIEGNINEYFDAIVSYPRLKRITFNDGIEFRSANKKLIFYNKVLKESKLNRGKRLLFYGQEVTGENLLRFEIQYLKVSGLQEQLSSIRTMNQVLDQSHILWDLILTEFAKVIFSSSGILDPDFKAKDTSQGLTALILIGFKGIKEPSDLVDEWYDRDIIKYNQKRSILNKIEEMSGNLILDRDYKAPLLQELTQKIINTSLPYYIHNYFLAKETQSKGLDLNGEIEV